MNKLLITLLFSIFLFSCKAQTPTINKATPKDNFPTNWVGSFKGDLQIYSVDSVGMKLAMTLDISKISDSIYQWKTTYKVEGKEADIRDYELKISDKKRGNYILDEKNSIEIGSFYRNKTLTSFFEVEGSYLVMTYTKINDGIIFEITAATGKKITKSGNTKHNGEDIPEVTSYFVNGKQKAILLKTK